MTGMFRIWKWEMLAMCGSIACLVAMAVLLAMFDNKPLFTLYTVSLNAIVALLSTLSKTMLLFVLGSTIGQWKWILFSRTSRPLTDAYIIDEASRGPLGSLWMIWRMKSSAFVTFGAICTVLSLATDPFTQQLIQYDNVMSLYTGAQAAIPRAQRFSRSSGGSWNLNEILSRNITKIYYDNDLRAMLSDGNLVVSPLVPSAVLYGLARPKDSVTQQLQFVCPTGNCTFDAFQSLAVCSKCLDLHDKLTSSFDDIPIGAILDQSGSGIIRSNGTRFALPNGLYISNPDYELDPEIRQTQALMTTFGTGNSSKTVALQDVDTLIWATTILRTQFDSNSENFTWPNVPLDAFECGLYYCVNHYESSVKSGSLHEDIVVNSSALRSPDSWQPRPRDDALVITMDGLEPFLSSLEYDNVLSLIPRTDLSLGDGFNISQEAVESVSRYFQTLLTNYSITNNLSEGVFVTGYYAQKATRNLFKPASMQYLFASSDLVELFDTVALSLSNALRTESDGSISQGGVVQQSETLYSIRWPWISLHVALVLFCVCDVALTIRMTSTENAPAWKSHLMATMAWGGQLDDPMSGATTTAEMEKLGRSQTASVDQTVSTDCKLHLSPIDHDGSPAVLTGNQPVSSVQPYRGQTEDDPIRHRYTKSDVHNSIIETSRLTRHPAPFSGRE